MRVSSFESPELNAASRSNAQRLWFLGRRRAAALAEELQDMGTARVTLADGLPAQGESYDLILLLQGMDPERLGAIARPGALVIDACREKNSEWIIHDPSLHYRRIRVISTAGF